MGNMSMRAPERAVVDRHGTGDVVLFDDDRRTARRLCDDGGRLRWRRLLQRLNHYIADALIAQHDQLVDVWPARYSVGGEYASR